MSASPEALDAAAAVLGDIAEEGGEAAAELAAPPLIPRAAEEAAAPEEPQDAPDDAVTLDPEIPEEIQDLLEEPDDEEPETHEWRDDTLEPRDPNADPAEYEDPEVAQLRQRAIKAEKRAAFLEGQKVKSARAGWAKEAEKVFPLSAPTTIEADSRRAFLKAAKARHDANKAVLEPLLEQERAKLHAELAERWGRPHSGGAVPSQAAVRQREIEEPMRRRDLKGAIRAMMEPGGGLENV